MAVCWRQCAPTLQTQTSIHRPIAAEERLLRVMRRVGLLLLLLSACRAGSTLARGLGFRFLRFRLFVVHLSRCYSGGFQLELHSFPTRGASRICAWMR